MSLSTTKEASCALFSLSTLLLALTDGSDSSAPVEVESSSLTSSDSAGMSSVKPLGADSFFSGLVLSALTASSSGCSEDNFFLGLGLGMSPSRKDSQQRDSQFYIKLTLID